MAKKKTMGQLMRENQILRMEYALGYIKPRNFRHRRKCLNRRMERLCANRHEDAV